MFNAGIFNSGLLAVEWPDEAGHYDYQAAPAEAGAPGARSRRFAGAMA